MSDCPSEIRLNRLLADEVDDPNQLLDHVESCQSCQSALERISEDAELSSWRDIRVKQEHERDTNQPIAETPPPPTSAQTAPRQKTLGDYELLDHIATGGMGVVYRARQRKLGRDVAVKVIRAGQFASSEEILRFRAEAAAAGKLQHPNIVAVHEVGQWNDEDYFSMELVEGESLAERIREHPLSADSAAGLVRDVALAVQYAHEQGVLHRDLKPSNVLIDQQDRPRVTDFGVAKIVELPEDDSDVVQPHTCSGTVVGTPNYMSPEQASGREAAAASDVYSLGAILYDTITGRPPFSADSALETMRQVQDTDPVSPRSLNPNIPLDLQTICLKCLHKDSERRYGSAQELANDLDRFLKQVPILARSIGNLERFSRWCRRNPRIAALGGLSASLLISLAVGSSIAAFWIHQAKQDSDSARELARVESRIAREVKDFLFRSILGQADPNIGSRELTVRQALDRASLTIEHRFTDQPLLEAEIRGVIGPAYLNLGATELAEPHILRSYELFEREKGESDAATLTALDWVADLYFAQGKYRQAQTAFDRARRKWERHHGADHHGKLAPLLGLANIQQRLGNTTDALQMNQNALEESKRILGPDHETTVACTSNLAGCLRSLGRIEQATSLVSQVLDWCRGHFGELHPKTLLIQRNLCVLYEQTGRVDKAESLARRLLEVSRSVLGPRHPSTIEALCRLATSVCRRGDLATGEGYWVDALAALRAVQGNDHPETLYTMIQLAHTYQDQGKFVEARKLFEEAVAGETRVQGPSHYHTLMAMEGLAQNRAFLNQPAQSKRIQLKLLDAYRANPIDSFPIYQTLYPLAVSEMSEGDYQSAEKLLHECLSVCQKHFPREPTRWQAYLKLAAVLSTLGMKEEADEMLLRGYEAIQSVGIADHPDAADYVNTAIAYYTSAKREDMVELWQKKLSPSWIQF